MSKQPRNKNNIEQSIPHKTPRNKKEKFAPNVETGSLNGYEHFKARTPNQAKALEAINSGTIVILEGSSGSGKSMLAVYKAVEALIDQKIKKIVMTRPVREAGEELGFIPGEINDKFAPYAAPLITLLQKLLPSTTVNNFIAGNCIEIIPIAYLRGTTLENSYIIVDEAQNCTVEQIILLITRIGKYSKLIVTGDITQCDLEKYKKSGLKHLKELLENNTNDEIKVITFGKEDNQRNPIINEVLSLHEKYIENKNGTTI